MPVIANLIVGINGATTIAGRSGPMSDTDDRQRFHELRKRADAIVIGGATSRAEPYASTPVPLIVISHELLIPGSAQRNPLARLSSGTILQTLAQYSSEFSTILIEAGAGLLEEALRAHLVDELYLTRVEKSGDAPFFTVDPLTCGLILSENIQSQSGLFQRYARLP
jgi:riboflavin biosynthesis pyrimidine reductase